MSDTARRGVQASASARRLAGLRINCLSASVLLIVQLGLGVGINLYVSLPEHKAFFSTVFGSAAVAVHAIVGLMLVASAISALIRAIRSWTAIALTSAGLAAVAGAWAAGAVFAGNQSSGASLAMALATAIAMLCYLVALFTLRNGRPERARSGGEN